MAVQINHIIKTDKLVVIFKLNKIMVDKNFQKIAAGGPSAVLIKYYLFFEN